MNKSLDERARKLFYSDVKNNYKFRTFSLKCAELILDSINSDSDNYVILKEYIIAIRSNKDRLMDYTKNVIKVAKNDVKLRHAAWTVASLFLDIPYETFINSVIILGDIKGDELLKEIE